MKIRNLIYGTAVVLLTTFVLVNESNACPAGADKNCPSGWRYDYTICRCIEPDEYWGGGDPMKDMDNFYMNNNLQGGEYTGGVVFDRDDPEKMTEVCGTKEVGGDITYCCHMSSGPTSNLLDGAKDLLNSMQNSNMLDAAPANSAVDALKNFTN